MSSKYKIQIQNQIVSQIIPGLIFLIFLLIILKIAATISQGVLFILPFTVIFVVIIIGAVYSAVYFSLLEYNLDKKNISMKGGIIARFERIIPYSKIQHIVIYESLFQRILGISSIGIQDARPQIVTDRNQNQLQANLIIPGLLKADAIKLKDEILKEVIKTKSGQGL